MVIKIFLDLIVTIILKLNFPMYPFLLARNCIFAMFFVQTKMGASEDSSWIIQPEKVSNINEIRKYFWSYRGWFLKCTPSIRKKVCTSGYPVHFKGLLLWMAEIFDKNTFLGISEWIFYYYFKIRIIFDVVL